MKGARPLLALPCPTNPRSMARSLHCAQVLFAAAAGTIEEAVIANIEKAKLIRAVLFIDQSSRFPQKAALNRNGNIEMTASAPAAPILLLRAVPLQTVAYGFKPGHC